MKVRLAVDGDKDRWNEFVFNLSDCPSYLYEWKEILERVYKYDCKYLMVEERHRVVGVFPTATLRSKLFGVRIFSLPFSDYGGPLFATEEADCSLLSLFLDSLSSDLNEADYLEVRSPTQANVHACLNKTFEPGKVTYLTFIIDLNKPYEEIWRHKFGKYLRNAIRKAVKNRIYVIEKSSRENLYSFYNLYLLTMKKLGSPPHGLEFFEACFDLLGDRRVKLFEAMISDKVIGAVVAFVGRHTIYPAYEGIDPKYRNLNVASLLFSQIIKWGCENGYQLFDFGRTLPGSGVYRFKKPWGGEEKLSPYYYMGKKIPQQDPREEYRILSKVWSKTPISIARRLGPYVKGGVGH